MMSFLEAMESPKSPEDSSSTSPSCNQEKPSELLKDEEAVEDEPYQPESVKNELKTEEIKEEKANKEKKYFNI